MQNYIELEELKEIQGSSFSVKINYKAFVENVEVIPDLTDYEAWIVLYPHGQENEEEVAFRKQMTLLDSTTNTFKVDLTTEETKNFEGAYTFESVLKNINGKLEKNARATWYFLRSGISEI